MVISAYLNFTRFGLWAQLQQALSTVFPLTSPAPPVMLFDVTPRGDDLNNSACLLESQALSELVRYKSW
jgi:hypothetical protein